jgi:hypothetical protein
VKSWYLFKLDLKLVLSLISHEFRVTLQLQVLLAQSQGLLSRLEILGPQLLQGLDLDPLKLLLLLLVLVLPHDLSLFYRLDLLVYIPQHLRALRVEELVLVFRMVACSGSEV